MKAEKQDVVVVGSGPGGVSTALAIEQLAPELARKLVVLEARRHPREKVCAGCITGRALGLFERLGIQLKTPHVPVYTARFRTKWGDLLARSQALYGAVVRRDEFDAAASAELPRRGIELRQGVRVQGLSRRNGRIVINTNKGAISARAVVGADGAGSVVRQQLDCIKNTTLLIQAELPIEKEHPAHATQTIEFDFRKVPEGHRGYRWTFPFLKNGTPHVNVGICEWNHGSADDLKKTLIQYLKSENFDPQNARYRFFPERPFRPEGPFCAPGILLVGDAAGIDPFLGEGLSYSVEYGMLAAESIVKAVADDDFSFNDYRRIVSRSRLGKTLFILHLIAKYFYGPLHERLVRNGLMDQNISREVGEFLAGKIRPTAALVLNIAMRLARNTLLV